MTQSPTTDIKRRIRGGSTRKTVVVGFSDAPAARNALDYAAGLVWREQGRLVVASIVGSPDTLVAVDGHAMTLPPSENDPESRLRAKVIELLSGGPSVRWTFVSRYGSTVAELEHIAAAHDADLIVIGRSRRRRFARSPSVSAGLLRRAGRPVIVIP